MKTVLRVLLVLLAVVSAGWWLFYLTPSRGAQRANVVRFAFWGDFQDYEMWKGVAERFCHARPGVRVELEFVPGAGEYPRKLTAWLASDSTPDVLLLQEEPMPRYLQMIAAGRHVIVDLTHLTKESVASSDFWPSAWESFGVRQADGWHQYALPVFGGNNLLFYNRECFRRAGVPLPEESGLDNDWRVDQFVSLARRLTLREPCAGRVRTVQWGFNRPAGWLYWLPFIYACDADVLNADRTEFIFTDAKALASLTLWNDLHRRYGCVPSRADLGQMNENVAFLTGTVAMVSNGPWAMPFFNEAGLDYGVLYPPLSPTGERGTRVTWDGVALAGRLRDDPAKLQLAYEFARYVASPEVAEIIGRAQRSIPANLAGREAFVRGQDGRHSDAAAKFLAAMKFSRVQPITLQWDAMDWALRDALGPLTRGKVTPEATLEDMSRRMLKGGIFPVRTADGRLLRMAEAGQ